jgi:hypothetical protein
MGISTTTRTGILAATAAICALGAALLTSGCQTKADRDAAFMTALNTYYGNQDDCLFASPIKFPQTLNRGDENEVKEFDALVDAGLLQREGVEKTRRARHEESGGKYGLSDIGQVDWTADDAHPGYGNFCYGHPQVNTIESYSKVSSGSYRVSYRDDLMLPAWAQTPQVEKVFPKIAKARNVQTATATLERNGSGWQVQKVSPATGS